MRRKEGRLAYLLEFLNGTTVDTSALVNEMACFLYVNQMSKRLGGGLTSRGRLARIDVADDDHVDVHLFFTT